MTLCHILPERRGWVNMIEALLSYSGWAAQPWITDGPSPLSGAGYHSAGILSLTGTGTAWPKPSVAPGYINVWCPPAYWWPTHLPPSPNSTTSRGQGDFPISSTGCICFAVLMLIYTGASLDWRLGRGSICYTSIQLNVLNYCDLTQIFLIYINHLFAPIELV